MTFGWQEVAMKSSAELQRVKRGAVRMVYAAALIFSMSPSPIARPGPGTASAGGVVKMGIAVSGSQSPMSPKIVTREKEVVLPARTVERNCASEGDAPCPVTLIELQ